MKANDSFTAKPWRIGPIPFADRQAFRSLALLIWLLLAGIPARLLAADPPEFGASLCLVAKFSQGQPERQIPMMSELGVGWVREHVAWEQFEPRPGQYAGLAPGLLRQLAFYREHDIGLVALLSLRNPVAYPGAGGGDSVQSYDPEAFGRFALAAAQALEREGVRFVLEIGNEPHNSSLLPLLGGNWNAAPPSPWVAHYVRMANAAVAAVKGWNPAVKLLAQDDMWIIQYRFLDAGLSPEIDGLSVHPYVNGIPERAAVAHDTDWTRPYQLVDRSRAFLSAVRRLRAHALLRLGRVPEIWITEWGWPVQTRPPAFSATEVAQYLPRAFLLAAEAGIAANCWFSSQDSVDGPMGLTTNQGGRRPAYDAYRTLAAQLGQLKFESRVFGSADNVEGLHGFRLVNADGAARIVIWNAGTEPWKLDLAGAGTAVGFDGAVLQPVRGADGHACLALDAGPVYLAGDWSRAGAVVASRGRPGCAPAEAAQ
ncbi:hypothetical protein [Derxia lacustris]|uniref:hypothetical protein n=1 Tax=Derxia lacustris TaxID=764842 RepID=UPI000A1717F1|nr:hypothetical protein [Derxia lacustris]